MDDRRKTISPEEALRLLPDGAVIHTYAVTGRMLIGVDWPREEAVDAIGKSFALALSGPSMRGLGHALVVWDTEDHYRFFATERGALGDLDAAQAVEGV